MRFQPTTNRDKLSERALDVLYAGSGASKSKLLITQEIDDVAMNALHRFRPWRNGRDGAEQTGFFG